METNVYQTIIKPTRKGKFMGEGYLRWKKQLDALKKHDVYTVKQLAREARDSYSLKYTGKVQLSFS
jgi:hypothetical protein